MRVWLDAGSDFNARFVFPMPTEMRVVPTPSVRDPADFVAFTGAGTSHAATAMDFALPITDQQAVIGIVTSGLTAGQAVQLNTIAAGSYIDLSADI